MDTTTRYTPVFIDEQPYAVRLLTSDEWDKVIDVVGENDELLHYSESPSWVQDKRDDWSSRYIVRGGQQARTKDSYYKTDRGPLVGFRPCLEPLNFFTFFPDSSRFSNIKNGDVLTFGSILVSGHEYPFPVPKTRDSEGKITHHYGSSPICICDSKNKEEYDIQWVKAGNLLVADRNLLKNVSWEQHDTWGLVFGTDEKAVHTESQSHSLYDLISQVKSRSEQYAKLTSEIQKCKNELEK